MGQPSFFIVISFNLRNYIERERLLCGIFFFMLL